MIVQKKTVSLRGDLAKSESMTGRFAIFQRQEQIIEHGREFVPSVGPRHGKEIIESPLGRTFEFDRIKGLPVIASPNVQPNVSSVNFASAKCAMHRDPIGMRLKMDVFDPGPFGCHELDFADDAVPISLRMIRDTVGVDSDINDVAVVHSDGETVTAARGILRKDIAMRRGEAVLAAEILSVQPDTRLPVGRSSSSTKRFPAHSFGMSISF